MALNLLYPAMAATAILGCNKPFIFLKWLDSTTNAMGQDIPIFAEPINTTGSIQAVKNNMYEQFGLQLDKHYITVFSPILIESLAQNPKPDRIIYENKTFEVVENADWYATNGWTRALMVELKELRTDGNTSQF